jgi:hypothetical protein
LEEVNFDFLSFSISTNNMPFSFAFDNFDFDEKAPDRTRARKILLESQQKKVERSAKAICKQGKKTHNEDLK